MKEFEEAAKAHIEEAIFSAQSLTVRLLPMQTIIYIMKSIQDNANRVIEANQSFDDAVEAIIESIKTL